MMRPQFFRKPAAEPSISEDDLTSLRETIVSRLLWSAVILGIPAILLALRPSLDNKRWVSIGIYVGAYLLLLVVSILQERLPQWVKIGCLIAPVYALGIINLVNNGLMKDGAVFLLAFIFLVGLLLGMYAGLLALGTSLISFGIVGGLITSKVLPAPGPNVSTNPAEWFSTGGVLTLLGIIVTLAMTAMLQGLEKGLQQRGRLAGDLERDRELLKTRTHDLQRRLTQMRTAAEISRRFSTVMEPQSLLQQAADLLAERLDLYFVGIFLIDGQDASQSQFARLRAGSGEAGRKLLEDEYQVLIGGTSLVSQAINDRKARLSNETARDEFRTVNPMLPLTRSEAALPLTTSQHILGVMSLQSSKNSAFDADDVAILQGIAETIANTLENDRLFQHLQTSLEEIQRLNEQYTIRSWAEVVKESALKHEYQTAPSEEGTQPAEKLEIPLVLRQQKIGNIKLEGGNLADWSAEQKAFAQAVALQATQALENVRLIKETQRRAARQQFVADFARAVRASNDIETILRTSLRELAQNLQASDALIQLKIPSGQAKRPDTPDEEPLTEPA